MLKKCIFGHFWRVCWPISQPRKVQIAQILQNSNSPDLIHLENISTCEKNENEKIRFLALFAQLFGGLQNFYLTSKHNYKFIRTNNLPRAFKRTLDRPGPAALGQDANRTNRQTNIHLRIIVYNTHIIFIIEY